MKEFSDSMALVDFVPVLLFAAAGVILMRDLYNKMSKGAFALFAAGLIEVTCAGALKALYKLLYAYDRILAMGSDTLIAELYDTTVGGFSAPALDRVVKEAAELPDRDPGVHWYDDIRLPQSISKKGKKARTPAFDRLALDHMRAWLHAECKPLTDRDAKRAKTNAYVNGLLEHGGPSTDVFKQVLGAEKTAELFHRVLFGTN